MGREVGRVECSGGGVRDGSDELLLWQPAEQRFKALDILTFPRRENERDGE